MDLTVAEISERLNVSKVTIYKKLKELKQELKPHIQTRNNVKYIGLEGFEIIKNAVSFKGGLNESEGENLEPLKEEGLNPFNQLKEIYINGLNEQINFLKKEIDIKNEQLQKKDELLKNFQVLLLHEQQDKKLLEDKINQFENLEPEPEPPPEKSNLFSWFKGIFS